MPRDRSQPFRKWFDGLNAEASAKVTTAVERIRQGYSSNVKSVGGVFEYKIDFGPGYRVYFERNKEKSEMALTKDFKETIQARARRDPAFRIALLREAFECLLAGDVDTGKLVLRNYINATEGFGRLGERMHKSPKSVMRMLSPSGNATAKNVFQILFQLQRAERIRFKLKASAPTGSFLAQRRKANHRNEQRRASTGKP